MQDIARGQCCWIDLAAGDIDSARSFYGRLLGWTAPDIPAHGGSFVGLTSAGRQVGSMYRLTEAQIERGVPAHWTPYIRVDDVGEAAADAAALGGQVLVRPFAVSGLAHVAMIMDPVGAHVGLWQPLRADGDR